MKVDYITSDPHVNGKNTQPLQEKAVTLADILAYTENSSFSIIPIIPGTKKPAIKWELFQERIATQPEIEKWLRKNSNYGWAVVGGKVSRGLTILDIEGRFTKEQRAEFFELIKEHVPEVLKSMVMVKTPTNGLHLYYLSSNPQGNQKLAHTIQKLSEEEVAALPFKTDGTPNRKAKDAKGHCPWTGVFRHEDGWAKKLCAIETRGEGGYALCPLSGAHVHPAGRPYETIEGSWADLKAITIEQEEVLLNIARSFDEGIVVPEEMPVFTPQYSSISGEEDGRPGTAWEKQPNIVQILVELFKVHGWAWYRQDSMGILLSRPDQPKPAHPSVRIFPNGICYFFTSNAYPFEIGRGYKPFAVRVGLNTGGLSKEDFKTEAKQAQEEGFGVRSAGKMVLTGITAEPTYPTSGANALQPQPATVTQPMAASHPHLMAVPAQDENDWPSFLPWGIQERLDFPIDGLPLQMKTWVQAITKRFGMCATVPSFEGIVNTSAAIAGKFLIHAAEDWKNCPVNLGAWVFDDPSRNKSLAHDHAVEPGLQYQKEKRAEYDAAKPKLERRLADLEKLREHIFKLALKEYGEKTGFPVSGQSDQSPWQAKLDALDQEIEEIKAQIKARPRFILSGNTTMEVLIKRAAEQKAPIAIIADEMGLLYKMAGQYNSGNPEFEVVLKGLDSKAYDAARIRGDDESDCVTITELLVGQPTFLRVIGNTKEFEDRGLNGRHLFGWPPYRGYVPRGEEPIADKVIADFQAPIAKLWRLHRSTPGVIRLTPKWSKAQEQLGEQLKQRAAENGDLHFMEYWTGKLVGNLLRVAACLHAYENPDDPTAIPISDQIMEFVLGPFCEFAINNATACYIEMGIGDQQKVAQKVFNWAKDPKHHIDEGGVRYFHKQACWQAIKNHGRINNDMDRLDQGLSLLQQNGYIRPFVLARKGRGRRPELFEIRQEALEWR